VRPFPHPIRILDEPTTGLDTRSRLVLWEVVRELAAQGTTVLLTTQYLEEADHLAERIAVIDHGRVVADGTPSELKAAVGATELVLTVAADSDITRGADVIEQTGFASDQVHIDRDLRQLRFLANEHPHMASDLIGALSRAGTRVETFTTRQPTLDQVFLTLTGRPASAPASGPEQEADTELSSSNARTTA
jgi:ABC-2 type transport system ATP-binding protein